MKGYPTVLVFNHKGDLIDKIVGYKDAMSFKMALSKHESKSYVKAIDTSLLNEYTNYQRQDMQLLEQGLLRNSMDEFSIYKQDALKLGEENNRFEFEELQFDLEKKYGNAKAKEMELYYQLGAKDEESIQLEVIHLRKQGFMSNDQLAYFIRYFSVDIKPSIRQLRWVNELLLDEKSEDLLELKVFVQFRFGDFEDAKSTFKEFYKKKNNKKSPRTKLLEALVNQ